MKLYEKWLQPWREGMKLNQQIRQTWQEGTKIKQENAIKRANLKKLRGLK